MNEKNPIFTAPREDASREELLELVIKLQTSLREIMKENRKRIYRLREQRKDIERKNKAIGKLKSRIQVLENDFPSKEGGGFLSSLFNLIRGLKKS